MNDNKPMDPNKVKEQQKKMTGYLSMFNFLLAFLVGYYYGFHYAALLTAIVSLVIGFISDVEEASLPKKIWKLASPFVLMIGVGFINPTVIPLGISGVLFTAIGLHLKTLNKPFSITLIIASSALSLAAYGALIEYPRYIQSLLGEERQEQIADFEVVSTDGHTVHLSEFKGNVVLLDFWATWCKPCRDEFKELKQLTSEFSNNENVNFLIINAKGSKDSIEKIMEFEKQNNYQLPFYKDQTGFATSNVKVTDYPTLALIDKQGNLRYFHSGYSNAENLKDLLTEKINALLKE